MSYKVQTKTTLQQYSKRENEVIRRFRDFAWLHTKLQDQNRGKLWRTVLSCDVNRVMSFKCIHVQFCSWLGLYAAVF